MRNRFLLTLFLLLALVLGFFLGVLWQHQRCKKQIDHLEVLQYYNQRLIAASSLQMLASLSLGKNGADINGIMVRKLELLTESLLSSTEFYAKFNSAHDLLVYRPDIESLNRWAQEHGNIKMSRDTSRILAILSSNHD